MMMAGGKCRECRKEANDCRHPLKVYWSPIFHHKYVYPMCSCLVDVGLQGAP